MRESLLQNGGLKAKAKHLQKTKKHRGGAVLKWSRHPGGQTIGANLSKKEGQETPKRNQKRGALKEGKAPCLRSKLHRMQVQRERTPLAQKSKDIAGTQIPQLGSLPTKQNPF